MNFRLKMQKDSRLVTGGCLSHADYGRPAGK
jgi:hypothetical protein